MSEPGCKQEIHPPYCTWSWSSSNILKFRKESKEKCWGMLRRMPISIFDVGHSEMYLATGVLTGRLFSQDDHHTRCFTCTKCYALNIVLILQFMSHVWPRWIKTFLVYDGRSSTTLTSTVAFEKLLGENFELLANLMKII